MSIDTTRRNTPPRPAVAAPLILLVADDVPTGERLVSSLGMEGFRVHWVRDGAQAVDIWRWQHPALVLLDLVLPGLDGIEICRRLRTETDVPIILFAGVGTEIDPIDGLEGGADDYVTRPFSTRELLARIRAVLRRGPMFGPTECSEAIEASGVVVDRSRHQVLVDGKTLELLPPKEFDLLELLVTNAGRTLTRDQLLELVWGPDYGGNSKTVTVHVGRLRRRIEPQPQMPQRIVTVRGVGYRFNDPDLEEKT